MLKALKIFLLLGVGFVLGQKNQQPAPLQWIYPAPNSRHWVAELEVRAKTAPNVQLQLGPRKITADSSGLVIGHIKLNPGINRIPVFIPTYHYRDTLTLTLAVWDHLDSNGNFINNNLPPDGTIHIVFPKSGPIGTDRIGLRAYTHPEAKVLINRKHVHVYPSGAFTTVLRLRPGKNLFFFESRWRGKIFRDTLALLYPVRKSARLSWFSPIDTRTCWPRQPVWVQPGERISVGFRGRSGAKAFYRFSSEAGWHSLAEEKPGLYKAVAIVPTVKGDTPQPITIHYRLQQLGLFSWYAENRDTLIVLPHPLGGVSIHPDTRVYDQADDGRLFFPLPDGIDFIITGRQGRFYRIGLFPGRSGWVKDDRVKLLPSPRIVPPVVVGALSGERQGDWQIYRLPVGPIHPPFEIKERYAPRRIELRLYGATQGWEWTTFADSAGDLAYIERTQPFDNVWQMNFYSKSGVFWGWRAYYEGSDLVIALRDPPSINPDDLFQGIRIEIDPGHGGPQRGALGITGYAEADANLRYCRMLAAKLRAAGATVFMTRDEDRLVSLPERAAKARKDGVHIFVMAHNNAPAFSRDLTKVRGTSTYFTWPSAKPLSDKVYPHLLSTGLEPFGEVSRYYYYLTRQTEYLVYLVEGAFMTHPEDEMFLLTEEGLDKLATAVYRGLEDFLRNEASRQQTPHTSVRHP